MQEAVDDLITWSQLNRLNINSKKTKEMVLGSLDKDSVVPLKYRHQWSSEYPSTRFLA